MSVRTPPRLLDLAGVNLMREESLAFSALGDLPPELFPPLFMKAFEGRRIETLKAMVLDLWDMGQDFWIMCSGASTHGCSSSQMAPAAKHRKGPWITSSPTSLGGWSKVSIHLCCKKLKIVSMPIENIMKVLSMVQLDYIQEVEVNCIWHLSTLAMFAPFLGEMSNVQRLLLSHIHLSAFEEQEQHHVQIMSQFLRLPQLHDLHLKSPSFLEGSLDQML
eukprot:bmy_19350T0